MPFGQGHYFYRQVSFKFDREIYYSSNIYSLLTSQPSPLYQYIAISIVSASCLSVFRTFRLSDFLTFGLLIRLLRLPVLRHHRQQAEFLFIKYILCYILQDLCVGVVYCMEDFFEARYTII